MRLGHRLALMLAAFVLLHGTVSISHSAPPTAEQIEKMKAAMPEEAPATPLKPRKMLVFTLCKGFRQGLSVPVLLAVVNNKNPSHCCLLSKNQNGLLTFLFHGVLLLFPIRKGAMRPFLHFQGSRPGLPQPQKATALAVDECGYGRDVVPLSPAVREANRRN